MPPTKNNQTAYFGGGCFWCTEAIFKRVKGVLSVTPGYAGGTSSSTNYEAVSSGSTGHAEIIQVVFDQKRVSYADLLDIFFNTHDPTTPNAQGPDIGTQYRSLILTTTFQQQTLAQQIKNKLDQSGQFSRPLVTQIQPFTHFIPAEKYHHDYFANHQDQPYCQLVIAPKIQHLLEKYPHQTQS